MKRSSADDDGTSADALPSKVREALSVAVDIDAPRAARLRAVATLEHTKEPHRRAVASALVPVLQDGPDVAGRVHLALLVLAPDLRLLREDQDGRDVFVVVDRGMGLDELHKLFGPGEDLPPFLTPPEKPAPQPYRDPVAVREEEMRALHERRRAEHAAFLSKMQDLGLDADDLDDDEEVSDDGRNLRRFVPLKGGTPWDSFSFVDDRDCVIDNGKDVVSLGRLRPGAWWSEATAGDHKGARRFRLGVAVDMAPKFTTRRERALEVGTKGITITAGHADLDVAVDGRGVVVWVDVDPSGGADPDLFGDDDDDEDAGGEVVGITLTWSSWVSFRGDAEKGPLSRNPGAKKARF